MSTSNIFLPASFGAFAGILLGSLAGIDIIATIGLAAIVAVVTVVFESTFESENPTDYEN
ncbi:hypothetical protein [Halorubrum sp. Eb13]|uniref:hypothetical protein n=1 Tax=Halorubrum sp. Eb13 TaxID=1383843 RepID=UPI00113FEDA6|nr:hypothetical protein [Halorubrum sp. Eb13]